MSEQECLELMTGQPRRLPEERVCACMLQMCSQLILLKMP